jgi:hypothetical protein
MTAKRRRQVYDPENPGQMREVEEETPEAQAAEVTPPLTEQQIKLNELDAYYGKVLGDLAREKQEADAVHDASEKRMADLEVQKAQIDAEYAERKAAIEAEPAPEAPPPATRWGTAPVVAPKKAEPALTS